MCYLKVLLDVLFNVLSVILRLTGTELVLDQYCASTKLLL